MYSIVFAARKSINIIYYWAVKRCHGTRATHKSFTKTTVSFFMIRQDLWGEICSVSRVQCIMQCHFDHSTSEKIVSTHRQLRPGERLLAGEGGGGGTRPSRRTTSWMSHNDMNVTLCCWMSLSEACWPGVCLGPGPGLRSVHHIGRAWARAAVLVRGGRLERVVLGGGPGGGVLVILVLLARARLQHGHSSPGPAQCQHSEAE